LEGVRGAATRSRASPPRPLAAAGWRGRDADALGAVDVEASAAPSRAFARRAAHGASTPAAEQEVVEIEHAYSAMQFYKDKVQTLKEERGDKDHGPISGNIYMYRAIAAFGKCVDEKKNESLFQAQDGPYVWAGIIITIAIQIVAPFVLLVWAIQNVTTINDNVVGLEAWRYDHGSEESGFTYLTSRILAIMFLLLFTINGTYALKSDMAETEKMVCLCRVFNKVAKKIPYDPDTGLGFKPTHEGWLWAGAVLNSILVINLSLCMFFIFVIAASEANPKDIIFDAFGITFLYNLDDPSGDLSFLDELWDEGIMGDIYGTLADQAEIMDDIKSERQTRCTSNNIYQAAVYIMQSFVVLMPLCFVFFEGKAAGTEWE